MFCENCGAQIGDAAFCPHCGTRVNAPAGAAPAPAAPAQPAYYANAGTYAAPNSPLAGGPANSVMETVRRFAASRLLLAAALLFTLAAVLSFISNLVGTQVRIEYGYGYTEYTTLKQPVSSALGSFAFSALLAAGIWLTWASARDRSRQMQSSGLKLIKVVTIISLIGCILLALLMIALGALLLVAADSLHSTDVSGSYEFISKLMENESVKDFMQMLASIDELRISTLSDLMVVCALLCFVASIGFVFASIFEGRMLHTVNVMKRTVETGRPEWKISAFAAGLCYVFGVLSVIGGISLLANENVLGGFAAILSGASLFCFGLLQFQYRKAMKALC